MNRDLQTTTSRLPRSISSLSLTRWRIVTVVCLSFFLTSCNKYGEISPVAYEYAKALYAVTNRKATDRLDDVQQQIENAEDHHELSTKEARWLLQIVQLARQEDWQSASQKARQMMEEQIRSQPDGLHTG